MPVASQTQRGRVKQRQMEITELRQMSNANPWKEMERTVRTVDEEKVKDCTEDVDALLVFAGLYSAVLTGFLIESYKTLQSDPSQDYLRQIALQTSGYTFSNGYLNATSSSQLPPFQAATSAIRVNVCWFASLILSLTSASFGILVKQWLREFLAIAYISPQERIRIRDVRIQGLEDWKLFEIASFLPVLLQISLALFLIGLCFFTAAVHQSIGTTTLLLVCCWSFFFCLSVIAPLVSPRCPYKTTALKTVFRHARPHIRSFLGNTPILPVLCWLADVVRLVVSTIWRGFVWLSSQVSRYFSRWNVSHESEHACSNEAHFADIVNDGPRPEEFIDLSDDHMNPRILQELLPSVPQVFAPAQENRNTSSAEGFDSAIPFPVQGFSAIHQSNRDCGSSGLQGRHTDLLFGEEDTLRSIADNDLTVFRNIDSSFFDDRLLSLTQKALRLQPRPLHETLAFVTTIFRSRLGFHLSLPREQLELPQRALWPWTLSRSSRTAMAGILADSMAHELRHDLRTNWTRSSAIVPTWNASFAYTVLFVSSGEIPSGVPRLMEALTQDIDSAGVEWSPVDAFSNQLRTLERYGSSWPARSLLFFAQSLELLKARDAERCLVHVVHASFVDREGHPERDTYRRLLERARLDVLSDDADVIAPTPRRLVALLEVARVILHKCSLNDAGNREGFPSGITDLLTFVLDAIPIVNTALPDVDLRKSLTSTTGSEEPGLYRVLTGLFTTPHTIHPLFFFFTLNPRHLLIPTDASYHDHSFPDLVSSIICSQDESMSIVSHCASFFETYKIKLQQVDRSTILRLCSLIWKITVIVIDDETRAGWHSMLASAAACVRIGQGESQNLSVRPCGGNQHTEACDVAYNLLGWIHQRHDDGHDEPDEDVRPDRVARSLVPNEFIEVLCHSVCGLHSVDPENNKTFWRIKYLEDLDLMKSHQDGNQMPTRFKPDEGYTDTVGSHDVAADTHVSGHSSLRLSPKALHELDDVAGTHISTSEVEDVAGAPVITSIAPVAIAREDDLSPIHEVTYPDSDSVDDTPVASLNSDPPTPRE